MSEPFVHKKSLGQNFLNSDYVPKKMCDAAALTPGSRVLEIGPGTGALTKELLARGFLVHAVEADMRAIERLEETFATDIEKGVLVVHHSDARELNPPALGLTDGAYAVVANIPYYLSGFLFRQLLETTCQPHTLVFLVQKEVAERIARDKKESLLSLSVKAFGTPTYICTVKRSHFTPPPQVDSAIIAVSNISRGRFVAVSETDLFTLLHQGFGQKRKQLLGNLSTYYTRKQVAKTLESANLPLTVRAEDIPIDTWFIIAKQLLQSD